MPPKRKYAKHKSFLTPVLPIALGAVMIALFVAFSQPSFFRQEIASLTGGKIIPPDVIVPKREVAYRTGHFEDPADVEAVLGIKIRRRNQKITTPTKTAAVTTPAPVPVAPAPAPVAAKVVAVAPAPKTTPTVNAVVAAPSPAPTPVTPVATALAAPAPTPVVSAPAPKPAVVSAPAPAPVTSPVTVPASAPVPLAAPTAATAVVASPAPVATAVPVVKFIAPNYKYGLSMGENLSWMSEADVSAFFDNISSMGVGWVRVDFDWGAIQPKDAKTFDWSKLDIIVKYASAKNIKILPILDFAPNWAKLPACTAEFQCAPADPKQFAAFASAAVARYAPLGIHQWEIWNEPNIPTFWKPQPSPSDYYKLLKEAYTAIKAQDLTATVVSAGLAPAASQGQEIAPVDFLTQLYALGGGPYFDAVGFHPYSYPALATDNYSWNAWQQMSNTKTNIRSVMIANNDANKKVWLTEFGAPTGGPLGGVSIGSPLVGPLDHVDEALQAKIVFDAFTNYLTLPWAGPIFWYSYKDLGTSNSTNENFFGLVRYDGTAKPALAIFKGFLSGI